MNSLQQRKLAFADARAESIKFGKNLPRVLHNLDSWEHEEEQSLLQGHIGQVALKFRLLRRPFQKVPAVVAWLAQYHTICLGTVSWSWKARAVWGQISSA